ncbi:ATP12 family chaperone protein [Alteraurantiacibacter aestuarii]|uniref:Molecular chaperone n=1 Tax=Alteraurantiacibacter aestuarii TaxID=650004 RepID=A0A844ZPC6_9SPHN|nr:ATP12 family protein [Alteraurantiacibacter aestuarii]MXO88880.1 molecular chaperone [Alteraurantiacibacter aestuarii]
MKRFYSEVSIHSGDGGWHVALDTRPIKTQLGAPQVVPAKALAELLAGEWRAQGEEIDPGSFVFRDMADYAIDIIRADPDAAIANLVSFSQTDTLCYRADPEDALFARQEDVWDPLVAACEARHGVSFPRVSGISHEPQSEETTRRLSGALAQLDAFQLAGLQTLTALAASLIVGLAALEDGADAQALFDASNVEEDWQAQLWGWDVDARKVRDMRAKAFAMALEFTRAAHSA